MKATLPERAEHNPRAAATSENTLNLAALPAPQEPRREAATIFPISRSVKGDCAAQEDRGSMAAKADSRLPHCLGALYANPGPRVRGKSGSGWGGAVFCHKVASCCLVCEHSCFGTAVARRGSLACLFSASQPCSSQTPAPKRDGKAIPEAFNSHSEFSLSTRVGRGGGGGAHNCQHSDGA